ncbi:acyl-CoA N-acyltransferase [Backusella circina FSU 941]|nr:acyl-CoA N-acyltransferase [Backusella circina FSU 941]
MKQYINTKVIKVTSPDQLAAVEKVRYEVFCVEQGRPNTDDGSDDIADIWFVTCDEVLEDTILRKDVVIGTVRLVPKPDNSSRLGRLVVSKDARGQNVGKLLMEVAKKEAHSKGYESIYLHSQVEKQGFYNKMGFFVEENDADIFDEMGSSHINLWLRNP